MNTNEPDHTESTVPPVDIIHNTSDTTDIDPTVVFRNTLRVSNPLVVASVLPNEADELESNDYHDTVNKEPSTKFDRLSPTPIDSIETSISRENIFRSPTLYSNISEIPENSSITITSNESDSSYSIYRPEISSSANSENLAHGLAAITRYMSARPNRLNTNQESTHIGNWSEPDDSYSIRDSIISTISADSEGSVVDPPRGTKPVFVQPKKSNFKQKTATSETSSDSEESELHSVTRGISTNRDVEVMTERLVTNLRSASTKLSNPDFRSREVVSETTSESDKE